jgi:hypothetical protein
MVDKAKEDAVEQSTEVETVKDNHLGNQEVMPMQDSSKPVGHRIEVVWLCAGAVL